MTTRVAPSGHDGDALTPDGGWAGAPRLREGLGTPATRGARAFVWVMERIGGVHAGNLFRLLSSNRRVFYTWVPFAASLVPYGTLPRRTSELVVLRIAWRRRSRYEWGQHVDIANRAGVTLMEVKAVTVGPDAPLWSPDERTLLTAVDEFLDAGHISDERWHELARVYTQAELVELCLLIGHYSMLAGVLRTLGLELDPGLERRLSDATAAGLSHLKGPTQ